MTYLKLGSVVCLPPAKNCRHRVWRRPFYNPIALVTVFLSFFLFAALKLTNRTSATAFYTKIKIKVAWGQFEEALKLLEEWRMIEPDVR